MEGFRVLTLTYRMGEIPPEQRERLAELFEKFRAVASLYFWSKRLGLEGGVEQALERARGLPSYWRGAFNERSPLHLFSEIEEVKRPRKQVLKLPLTDALGERDGAYICGDKLVVRLGDRRRIELPVPRRALHWLRKREREVAPLKVHKTVRTQWREDKSPEVVKVQIIFKLQRQKPPRPDPKESVLCFVDVNSNYGIVAVVAAYDGQRVKVYETLKLRSPNRGRGLREAAKRQRAASYGSKPNVNRALARLSASYDSKGWTKAAAAKIFKHALTYAKERPVVMNFDVPRAESVRNSYLQKTLISLKRVTANLAAWYGVFITFQCYLSRECPVCGAHLKESRTGRARICTCRCGFEEERDQVPFYWWLKEVGLPLPRPPRLPKPDREARS